MKSLFKHNLFRQIFIVIIVIFFLLVLFLFATTFKAKSFQIDETVEEIFVGDSHVRYAVDDSLLINSLNMGNSSESTYFSYFKLKQILKSNPNITTIYLGFSYHNISGYYDQYTFGRYSREIAPNYFFILPIWEQLKMIEWNLKRFLHFKFSLLKSGVMTLVNQNTFQGGFDNPHRNVAAREKIMNERLDFQYYTDGKINPFSNLNLTYFDKIVTLCHSQKVQLIILNTPLHSYYRSKIPAKYANKYNSLVSSKNVIVMDLSQLDLPDYCFQPDGDLLSKEGSIKTTEEIIRKKLSMVRKITNEP